MGGGSSNVSSLGDYSAKPTFGSAFNAAHKTGGNGHTFDYNGKMYTTNTADKSDAREKSDNRGSYTHKFHQYGHNKNAVRKDVDHKKGYETKYLTKTLGYSKGKEWFSNLDRQRAEYHRREAKK